MSLKLRSILVLVVGVLVGLGVALGASRWTQRQAQADAGGALADEHVQLLAEVMARVRHEYVDPIDEASLVASAIRGIVADLDPHSRFLESGEYEDIRRTASGSYTGVGLDLRLRDGRIMVVEPLAGAPAARAGILPGDVVISVDAVPVDEHDVTRAVERMRGASGTRVTLGVEREGAPQPLQFPLTRAEIEVRTVHETDLGDGYAYVRLSGFAESTARDLERAGRGLRAAAGRDLAGLVLDLRGNPGGVLESAVEVADLFLAEGLIVRGSGRTRGAQFVQYAHPGAPLEHVPLAVLVDAGSASAAEIVAGALQDHGRGRLVGERTYGKGSVQSVLPLPGGEALKLTTSRYLTPAGRVINDVGIEPDFAVARSAHGAILQGPGTRARAGDDEQLAAALRLIGYDPLAQSRAR